MMPRNGLCGAIAALLYFGSSGGPAFATDIRVSLTTVSTTYAGLSVQFKKGGRVGNWISGTGNLIVLDASIPPISGPTNYTTNIFTISPSGGALTLISDPSAWIGGDGVSAHIPAVNYYLGNPWFCPGSASSAYILFQAQNNGSLLGVFGQPGGGYDNDIWLYRPQVGTTAPKVWKLTNYGTSGSTALGPAVLGPQCSQDSSSSANQLHIVYGHRLCYSGHHVLSEMPRRRLDLFGSFRRSNNRNRSRHVRQYPAPDWQLTPELEAHFFQENYHV